MSDPSDVDDQSVLVEIQRRFQHQTNGLESLEALITSPRGFGLITATPLQRAICRIIEGKPLTSLADHPHVKEAVGDTRYIDGQRPKHVILCCATRAGKSLITAGAGIWATQTCNFGMLGAGERPRVSILSTARDNARVIMQHIIGNITAKDALRPLLIGAAGSEELLLKGAMGREVEMTVVSGARAGSTLVSRWSAGVLIDEAARMVGASDGVINLDDARAAIYSRLLPGAQLIEITSPWLPIGPIFTDVNTYWGGGPNYGKKFASPDICVIRARGDWLNPVLWTPKFAADLLRKDPRAYKTDFLAEFSDADDTFFPQVLLDSATNPDLDNPTPPEVGYEYSACMDPATRGNAWTLVIATRKGHVKSVVGLWEWQGTSVEPLSPRRVLSQIGTILRGYGLTWCFTDQWAADAFVDIADEEGVDLLVEQRRRDETAKAFLALLLEMQAGHIVLPRHDMLRKDLTLIRKIPSPSPPGFKVVLPTTPDGRHCDFAPALVGALMRWLGEFEELRPIEGTDAWRKYQREEELKKRSGSFARASQAAEQARRLAEDPMGVEDMDTELPELPDPLLEDLEQHGY